MLIEIKIVGESTDKKMVALLALLAGNQNQPALKEDLAGTAEVVKDTTQETVITYDPPTPVLETPKEVAKPAQAVKSSKFTLEAVRAEAVAVSKSGNREEVKALIAKHGGEKVTDLDAEVYDAFMQDLANLKNGK